MQPVRRRHTTNTGNGNEPFRKAETKPRFLKRAKDLFLRLPWKKIVIRTGLITFGVLMVIQIFWPSSRLLPFTKIDGNVVSLTTKVDAIKQINQAYKNHTVEVYMGSSKKPVASPTLSEADITVDNTKRINDMHYPWYMRIVPTSLFWVGHFTGSVPKPVFGNNFDDYIAAHLMVKCHEDPVNATLKAQNGTLSVVKSKTGGACEEADVLKGIKQITPVLNKLTTVKVARTEIAAAVSDNTAKAAAADLNHRLSEGIALKVNNETVNIPANDVMSWLDFSADGTKLAVTVNDGRAGEWLNKTIAPKVAVAPGVTKISTIDFTETSRITGNTGKAIDLPQTIVSLQSVVSGGDTEAETMVKIVPATEQYTRSYSPNDVGISALMTNYAKDHPGTFGVSMVELDGKKRRASYNGDTQFVTASTYKLFVAYSLMKQIDAGQRDWSASEDCFNKMIKLSDNACATGFLYSIGVKTVTNDIQAVGLKNSTFMKSDNIYSTPNDLTLMLGMIATGQNFSSANQQRLIAAMKGNVYRSGIPAGVNGTVADKVGFMDGLLHDAAIVYGPNGTYALTIMTNGSSWATIADLAKQIDQLRAQ